MRVPPGIFKLDESKLDTSSEFLLSSNNSITLTRRAQAANQHPGLTQLQQSESVSKFFEVDPNTTAAIVSQNDSELQGKLLIEFPVFALNDEINRVLAGIVNAKIDSLRSQCRS